MEIEGSQGTITQVTPKGKLCIQMHESGEVKKIAINNLKIVDPLEFNFERLTFAESSIKTWANLLMLRQTLNGQDRKSYHGKII